MRDFMDITSKDNKLIKLVRSLQSSPKARRENGLFVLEGLRVCFDAADNGIAFKKLIVSHHFYDKFRAQAEHFAKLSKELYRIPDGLFAHIADTDSPQGIIAVADILCGEHSVVKGGKYIALENVNDPSNLGAVARTAEALGASGIVLTTNGCDPFSPKALRSSMGTLLRMPLFIVSDVIDFALENSLNTYACVPADDAENISQVSFSGGDMLLIGNEANGLLPQTIDRADKRITIPMHGRAESLNAAAAAAIAMWEMLK